MNRISGYFNLYNYWHKNKFSESEKLIIWKLVSKKLVRLALEEGPEISSKVRLISKEMAFEIDRKINAICNDYLEKPFPMEKIGIKNFSQALNFAIFKKLKNVELNTTNYLNDIKLASDRGINLKVSHIRNFDSPLQLKLKTLFFSLFFLTSGWGLLDSGRKLLYEQNTSNLLLFIPLLLSSVISIKELKKIHENL